MAREEHRSSEKSTPQPLHSHALQGADPQLVTSHQGSSSWDLGVLLLHVNSSILCLTFDSRLSCQSIILASYKAHAKLYIKILISLFIPHREVAQSCPTLCNPVDCSPPGSSVHGILMARILEWVAISFSRGSSQPGIKPRSPTLQADALTSEPPEKPFISHNIIIIIPGNTLVNTDGLNYHQYDTVF